MNKPVSKPLWWTDWLYDNIIIYFEDSLTVTFGVLFGLCILLIIVAVIAVPIILIMKHKLCKGNNGKPQLIIIIIMTS